MTGTIGDLLGQYDLTAHCHACGHSAEVDLKPLAAKYGLAARVRGPRQIGGGLLKCAQCASPQCSMRISPKGLPRFAG